jgi:hypothetical protein
MRGSRGPRSGYSGALTIENTVVFFPRFELNLIKRTVISSSERQLKEGSNRINESVRFSIFDDDMNKANTQADTQAMHIRLCIGAHTALSAEI